MCVGGGASCFCLSFFSFHDGVLHIAGYDPTPLATGLEGLLQPTHTALVMKKPSWTSVISLYVPFLPVVASRHCFPEWSMPMCRSWTQAMRCSSQWDG